jgi:hypothetical protein
VHGLAVVPRGLAGTQGTSCDRDVEAVLGKPNRDRLADAAAGARHECSVTHWFSRPAGRWLIAWMAARLKFGLAR